VKQLNYYHYKMYINNNFHLTYCTNIHPGKNWEINFENLKRYVPIIKEKISPDKKFGLGLRLSNQASIELKLNNNLSDFKNWLNNEDIYIFTMNGFPYGNFHGEKVKDLVHAPDWTKKERLVYTKRLFKQLTILIPDEISGGISTSPISYKHWFKNIKNKKMAISEGAINMSKIAIQLYKIEQETGKYMHLDIEPEPDGLLENSDEVINYFNNYLLPIGITVMRKELGLTESEANSYIKRYLTVCYDICHFSLAYENPIDTFEKFKKNEIKIGKIQVSSALKILFKNSSDQSIWKSLKEFDEPIYLHQVTELKNNIVKTYSDLPDLFVNKKSFKELRAHFHVPIFLEKFNHLYSTQDQIINVINYLKINPKICDHLEVETYTWEVLPSNLKTELSSSIVREIKWLINQL